MFKNFCQRFASTPEELSGYTKISHKRLYMEFLDDNAESIHDSQS